MKYSNSLCDVLDVIYPLDQNKSLSSRIEIELNLGLVGYFETLI